MNNTRRESPGESDSEDDARLHGGIRPPVQVSDAKAKRAQEQVRQVVGIMQDNVNKILERDERLDTLAQRSDLLNNSSHGFRVRAIGLRRQMWWQNCKIKIIIAIVIVGLLLAIIIPVAVTLSRDKKSNP